MGKAIVKGTDGVEFALHWNVGRVVDLDLDGARNGRVGFKVEGFRHNKGVVSTSVDKRLRPDLIEALQKAKADDVNVVFRVEVHRDPKVDPSLPFGQVSEEGEDAQRWRRLEAAAVDGTAEGTAIWATAEAEGNAGKIGVPVRLPSVPVPNEPSSAPEPMGTGGTKADTYEFAAATGSVDLAFELYATGAGERGYTQGDVKRLACHLLAAADHAQRSITGQTKRGSLSHTRARGAVRTALIKWAPPVGQDVDEETWTAWADTVARTAGAILRISQDVLDEVTP